MSIGLDRLQNFLLQTLSMPPSPTDGALVTPPVFSLPQEASQTFLTELSQRLLHFLDNLFVTPDQKKNALPDLVAIAQKLPRLLSPILEVIETLARENPSLKIAGPTLQLMRQMADHVEARARQLPPEAQVGLEDQAGTWLNEMARIFKPSVGFLRPGNTPAEVISFLSHALREKPQTFEHELFALATFRESGLDLKTYIRATHEVEPLKAALTLMALREAEKDGKGPLLTAFLKNLNQQVEKNLPLKDLFIAAQSAQKVALPKTVPASLENQVQFLSGRMVSFQEGSDTYLMAQALSHQTGVVPDGDLSVVPNPFQLSLAAGMMALNKIPAGIHRATLKTRQGKEVADLIFYAVKGSDEEEEEESGDHPESKKFKQRTGYESVATGLPRHTGPVAGNIALTLDGILPLSGPYNPDAAIPAPLQVSFQFLADVVDPRFKMSREKFLTLERSPEVRRFQDAVKDLGQKGMSCFDTYALALEVLFNRIEAAFPKSFGALDQARKFLRDEVLLYLIGKTPSDKTGKGAEINPAGDVMAAILSTTAGVCAAGHRESEALVHFAEAVTVAKNKPYFLKKLDEFFTTLRQQLSGKGSADWSQAMTVPPPGPTSKPVSQHLLLAPLFMEKVIVE